METTQRDIVNTARAAWGESYDSFDFLSHDEAARLETARDKLLASVADRVDHSFGGSKPHLGPLSPGCESCGNGSWSCVFVTRNCNASCFYCPAPRVADKMAPWADGLSFDDIGHFVDYARTLGIEGVSFSGGEPLLLIDKLVDSVAEVREALGPKVHIWVYSNGLLANEQKLDRLGAAGLDEIRFNIGATDFRLDRARIAIGRIPRVTVEIPAPPDEMEALKQSLFEMAEIGVSHLNLHELMSYGTNIGTLQERGYRFLPGMAMQVAESELTALRLFELALSEGIDVPINYCSTIFKSRWQTRGSNRRVNRLVANSFEGETAFGYVRQLYIEAEPDQLTNLATRFEPHGGSAELWSIDAELGRISFHHDALVWLEDESVTVFVQYLMPALLGDVITSGDSRPIELESGEYIRAFMRPVSEPIALNGERLQRFAAALAGDGYDEDVEPVLAKFERMGTGLGRVWAG